MWHDIRTESIVKRIKASHFDNYELHYQNTVGLPLNTYFSAVKMVWLIENVKAVKEQYDSDNVIFCNIDTWLLMNLTGNIYTDITNASRTMLMDIKSLEWSNVMLDVFGIKESNLPQIKPCCYDFGKLLDLGLDNLRNTEVTAILGDQQSAALGQFCMNPGDVKCT